VYPVDARLRLDSYPRSRTSRRSHFPEALVRLGPALRRPLRKAGRWCESKVGEGALSFTLMLDSAARGAVADAAPAKLGELKRPRRRLRRGDAVLRHPARALAPLLGTLERPTAISAGRAPWAHSGPRELARLVTGVALQVTAIGNRPARLRGHLHRRCGPRGCRSSFGATRARPSFDACAVGRGNSGGPPQWGPAAR
jgi:hypothetical protein